MHGLSGLSLCQYLPWTRSEFRLTPAHLLGPVRLLLLKWRWEKFWGNEAARLSCKDSIPMPMRDILKVGKISALLRLVI